MRKLKTNKLIIKKDIYANFECDRCNKREIGLAVECIYNGAPYCVDCEEEMSLQNFFHKKESKPNAQKENL